MFFDLVDCSHILQLFNLSSRLFDLHVFPVVLVTPGVLSVIFSHCLSSA